MGSYDAIIIGGGPGGYVAAERLGAAKKKVLLVEKGALGGTCLNVGCIPTKTLINSAKHYVHALEGARYGVKASGVSFDWAAMQAWKREVVEKLRAGVAATEKRLGVEVVAAEGRLLGGGMVEVRDASGKAQVHQAGAVIAATGSAPVMPPIPGWSTPRGSSSCPSRPGAWWSSAAASSASSSPASSRPWARRSRSSR